ncbi:MAG: glycine cleavage T C-terminal barrel domain-containing protein, partial [Arenicellales bacterium]|nr:glycine cleavage T C-terminal barrel domain-containing protein [Arenicellales bacterium]
PDYTPLETGLDRFVMYDKDADFIGKQAAIAEKQNNGQGNGEPRRLCTFIVDAADTDVWADEPIWAGDKVVGFVTSGGYAHHSKKSVAYGFLPMSMIKEGTVVEIEILGDRRSATLYTDPLFDPQATRMRG